ncbi:MAG: hypothetical protein HY287_10020 [Planctomycetes bacterium]|nr:hypothetical protein [Planctomycetota bacterium]MBI3834651.1 hypothetical protein [Planctomycetota bacterium]
MDEIDLLNELLSVEQANYAARLVESTVYVGSDSMQADRVVERMARTNREHCEQLTDLILDLGGSPTPRRFDTITADLHFQDLAFLLPRLIEYQKGLVAKYEEIVPRLSMIPRAQSLAARILERHQRDLSSLGAFSHSSAEPIH